MIPIKKCAKLPPVKYTPNPPFGSVFAPHVLKMELTNDGKNNFSAEIKNLEPEGFYPTLSGLHYGQTIFEGMKAYLQKDGSVGVFRADLHAKRFRASARRMIMAEIPEEVFLLCIKEYVNFVADNVPHEAGHSLYLRPLLFASDQKLKVGASLSFQFYIMSSIAGQYFSGKTTEVRPARVMVNREFVRAYPGGLGEIKTAANYAASIYPQKLASQNECDQVLFLDAVHHKYIDELGGMNFFAIRGDELITPALNGSILHGVTRRSILELAPTMGLKPIEKRMSFTELVKEIKSGDITETFACGTAAVVSPIGAFSFQEKVGSETELITLSEKPNVSLKILDKLSRIQRGHEPGPGNWVMKCT
jgi:branched-chain amino acid aminotransferase